MTSLAGSYLGSDFHELLELDFHEFFLGSDFHELLELDFHELFEPSIDVYLVGLVVVLVLALDFYIY
jgi:hypothetical protein